jgi:hypothetical protein
MHVESEFANAPGDEVVGGGDLDGEKTIQSQSLRLGAYQAGRTAIREDEEGEHLLQLMSLLKVEGAQFKVENKDSGIGLGADNVMGRLESVDGRVTAHEADHGSFD